VSITTGIGEGVRSIQAVEKLSLIVKKESNNLNRPDPSPLSALFRMKLTEEN
jgi:hypothetical protein